MNSHPGKIDVFREAGSFGILRSVKIHIDGSVAGSVKQGKTATNQVAPGSHTVRFSMDWCGSRTLTVEVPPGETVRLICRCRDQTNPFSMIKYLTVGRNDAIELRAE